MRLDAWLKQDRSLGERLDVVEHLCQAVNGAHGRGEALVALDPTRIELTAEGECDLSATRQGSPAPGYAAPDAGGDASAELANVYSVGAITWEILAGRPAGDSPAHLFKVRSDLPRELADAVMACLEGSADWRPKDLTYLAQMTATRQESEPRPKTSPRVTRPTKAAAVRSSPRRGTSRTWPLLAALVLVIGLAAGAAWRYLGPAGSSGSDPAPAATQAPPTTVAAASDLIPEATPAGSAPRATPAANPRPVATASAVPTPVAPLPDQPEPLPTATPTPTPTPLPVTPEPRMAPAQPGPAAVPAPATTGSGDGLPPAPAPQVAPPTPAPTAAPAVLSAVSPLEVKRPGKVMLDLRGTGFRPEHRARILALKKAPRGIIVIGQKLASESLIKVLLELDPKAETGEFAIAVEDSAGTQSAPLIFTISK